MMNRLKAWFRRDRLEGELDAELRFHLEMETERLIRAGVSPVEARSQALRSFGPVEVHKEEVRDFRGLRWLDELVQDVRFGARSLLKSRGFTFAAILTLGLGIGANTAIFSLINGVLLKPLPYGNGGRLVLIEQSAPLVNRPNFGVSIQELYDYRSRLQTVSGLVEFHQMSFDLLRRGDPDRVATGVVSHNFFEVLGIPPLLGRAFEAKDDELGAPAVIVLSYDYWKGKFAGDPKVIGQVVQMNDRPHTIVGVLPSVPLYPNSVDLYMSTSACPFRAMAQGQIAQNRRAFAALTVFGVLAPGRSIEEARAEVDTIARGFQVSFPEVYRSNSGFSAITRPVLGALTANARPMLILLLGTTGLVLLIACANVANLNLARVLQRERELALRAALGAGRRRIIQQLLTESCLVSMAGGIAGLGLAYATLGSLTSFIGRLTERTQSIELDLGVLGFTLIISLVTGVVFGIVPILAARAEPVQSLGSGSRGTTGGGYRGILQNALVVGQVGVSSALLVGAGLVLTSFLRLQEVDSGYQTARVLKADVFGNFSKYPDAASQLRFYEPLLERLRAIPGVQTAAITNAVPLAAGMPGAVQFMIEGQEKPLEAQPSTDVNIASAGYFETIAAPLLAGRTFADLDGRDSNPVTVINHRMVAYWAGRDPVGTRMSLDGGKKWLTVVGIVGNVLQYGLDQRPLAQVYVPLSQMTNGLAGTILIRFQGDFGALSAQLRSAVRAIDPEMPVKDVQTLEELRSGHLAQPRERAFLLFLFAVLALSVALTGIAGVLAYSVSKRVQEFGVRLALGATRRSVLGLVLGQGLKLVAFGLVVGLIASRGVSGLLEAYLFNTSPWEPSIFVAVTAVFLLAGLVACAVPAHRATSVDPQVALRAE